MIDVIKGAIEKGLPQALYTMIGLSIFVLIAWLYVKTKRAVGEKTTPKTRSVVALVFVIVALAILGWIIYTEGASPYG